MKQSVLLLPSTAKKLAVLGGNLRLARLRRRLSAGQVAERANISRSTLWMIEKGSPAVSIGSFCQVLFVLGLDNDLINVGADDDLGRELQDLQMEVKKRAPKVSAT